MWPNPFLNAKGWFIPQRSNFKMPIHSHFFKANGVSLCCKYQFSDKAFKQEAGFLKLCANCLSRFNRGHGQQEKLKLKAKAVK